MTAVGTATSGPYPPARLSRIESKAGVAESAAGDYAPIIETTDKAHRRRARAAGASHCPQTPNQGQKPAKDDGSPTFSGSKCIYGARHIPRLARRDLEP
jgi:hypothetical protein